MASYWTIKHKPTGAYFPLSDRGGKRGSTHIDLPFVGIPRLFSKSNAAKITLDWWLGGPAITEYDNDGDGRYSVGASLGKGRADRKLEEFEIIKVEIKE